MIDTIKYLLITFWLIACNIIGLGLYSFVWDLDRKKSKKSVK